MILGYISESCVIMGFRGDSEWPLTPVFLPGESHGQRSLEGYSPQGSKESDTTELLSMHTCTDRSESFLSKNLRPRSTSSAHTAAPALIQSTGVKTSVTGQFENSQ